MKQQRNPQKIIYSKSGRLLNSIPLKYTNNFKNHFQKIELKQKLDRVQKVQKQKIVQVHQNIQKNKKLNQINTNKNLKTKQITQLSIFQSDQCQKQQIQKLKCKIKYLNQHQQRSKQLYLQKILKLKKILAEQNFISLNLQQYLNKLNQQNQQQQNVLEQLKNYIFNQIQNNQQEKQIKIQSKKQNKENMKKNKRNNYPVNNKSDYGIFQIQKQQEFTGSDYYQSLNQNDYYQKRTKPSNSSKNNDQQCVQSSSIKNYRIKNPHLHSPKYNQVINRVRLWRNISNSSKSKLYLKENYLLKQSKNSQICGSKINIKNLATEKFQSTLKGNPQKQQIKLNQMQKKNQQNITIPKMPKKKHQQNIETKYKQSIVIKCGQKSKLKSNCRRLFKSKGSLTSSLKSTSQIYFLKRQKKSESQINFFVNEKLRQSENYSERPKQKYCSMNEYTIESEYFQN